MQKKGQAGWCGSNSMYWPSRAGRKEIALISLSCFLQIAASKSRCGPQINWPWVPMCQFLIGLFIAILSAIRLSLPPCYPHYSGVLSVCVLSLLPPATIQCVFSLLFKLWPTCRSFAQMSTKMLTILLFLSFMWKSFEKISIRYVCPDFTKHRPSHDY